MARKPKLRDRVKALASQFIAEEFRTKQYSPSQAKAIGISRARKQARQEKLRSTIQSLGHKYGLKA
jgi:hypothetical protein